MNIVVYCGSTTGNKNSYSEKARKLGEWIAEHGHTLVYGGADGGLMGAVANGALSKGGKVIGVLPDVEEIQKRRHMSLTEYINTKDMAQRKAAMIELADAYIALPGGPGTLDELSDIVSLSRLRLDENPCVMYDMDGYYQPLSKVFDGMIEAGFAEKEDFRNVLVSDDQDEIGNFIER